MSFIGVDVAKAQLEFSVWPSGETGTKTKDEPGIRALVTRYQGLAPALLVLEATGGVIRAFYQRLRAAEKPAKVALTAGMRKRLTLLDAMARSGAPWQPERTLARV